MTDTAWFSQQGYSCRFDWGRRGVREAAERGDIVVVVDVLRFSTAVTAAVERGGLVYPCAEDEDPQALARQIAAEVAGLGRRFTLSPRTYTDMEPGTRVVLPSPNGATCSRYGAGAPALFLGALVNAQAVGEAVTSAMEALGRPVTVIACGERWADSSEDGALRFAVEDYLGAGAILNVLTGTFSPEATVCRAVFQASRPNLQDILWECGSGRELREKGRGEDVRDAAQVDVSRAVPVLRDGRFERA